MSIAKLISDRDWEREYKLENGSIITLKLEDDLSAITFYDSTGAQLDGEFEFMDESENGVSYLLSRMYSPNRHKGFGLGRAALQFFKEFTNCNIYARTHDGNVRDDGSHLTGDAPGFVVRMQNENLLEDINEDYPEEYE